jgi:hypothetical protein
MYIQLDKQNSSSKQQKFKTILNQQQITPTPWCGEISRQLIDAGRNGKPTTVLDSLCQK